MAILSCNGRRNSRGPGRSRGDSALRHPPPHGRRAATPCARGGRRRSSLRYSSVRPGRSAVRLSHPPGTRPGVRLGRPGAHPSWCIGTAPPKTQAQRPQDAAALPTPTIKAVGARPVPKATGALAAGARPRGQPTAAPPSAASPPRVSLPVRSRQQQSPQSHCPQCIPARSLARGPRCAYPSTGMRVPKHTPCEKKHPHPPPPSCPKCQNVRIACITRHPVAHAIPRLFKHFRFRKAWPHPRHLATRQHYCGTLPQWSPNFCLLKTLSGRW